MVRFKMTFQLFDIDLEIKFQGNRINDVLVLFTLITLPLKCTLHLIEITVLMSGQLSDEISENEASLSAMAVYQTLNFLPAMVLWAINTSIMTRVSNELGSGNAFLAKRAGVCGILLMSGSGLIISFLLLVFRRGVSEIFVTDEGIIDLVYTLMMPLSIYMLMGAVCMAFEGIITGSGRQAYGAMVVIVSYFVFGVPVSYIFGFRLGYGVVGLVFGRVVGKFVHTLLYGCIYWMTNWDKQVDRARELIETINANDKIDCNLLDIENLADDEEDKGYDLEMEPLEEDMLKLTEAS